MEKHPTGYGYQNLRVSRWDCSLHIGELPVCFFCWKNFNSLLRSVNKTLEPYNQINARKCTCIFPENKGERIYYGSHFEGLGSVMGQGCDSRTVCAVLGQEAENRGTREQARQCRPCVMYAVTYCLPLGPPASLPHLQFHHMNPSCG